MWINATVNVTLIKYLVLRYSTKETSCTSCCFSDISVRFILFVYVSKTTITQVRQDIQLFFGCGVRHCVVSPQPYTIMVLIDPWCPVAFQKERKQCALLSFAPNHINSCYEKVALQKRAPNAGQ